MKRWEVTATGHFVEWYHTLQEAQADALDARVELLRDHGPTLGRPIVDRTSGSSLHSLKELRVRSDGELRVLFIFDSDRRAVLLVGGDKTGRWEVWYEKAVPLAEDLYEQYSRRRNA